VRIDVAHRIVRGIERRRPRVLIGKETWAIDLATRLAPGFTNTLVVLLCHARRWRELREKRLTDGAQPFCDTVVLRERKTIT